MGCALLIIAILVLSYLYTKRNSVGQERAKWSTLHYVRQLGVYIDYLEKRDNDVRALRSIDDLLALLNANNLKDVASGTAFSGHGEDAWRRPLRYYVQSTDEYFSAMIASDGRNGLPEFGQGDDVFCTVVLRKNGTRVVLGGVGGSTTPSLDKRILSEIRRILSYVGL
jgi:hypothetical protein